MSIQRISLLILGLTSLLLVNCKKETALPVDPLLAKTWKRATTDQNVASNPVGKIIYETVTDCQKDDSYKFSADGTLIVDRGTAKCETNEVRGEMATYSTIGKEITIKGVKYTLAEVSPTQVKYYAPLAPFSGYDYAVFLLQ